MHARPVQPGWRSPQTSTDLIQTQGRALWRSLSWEVGPFASYLEGREEPGRTDSMIIG